MDCRATADAVSRNDLEAWLSSSRILGIAVGLWELCGFWGRLATLVVVPFIKSATLPHCSPKAESLQNSAEFFYHKDRIIPPLRLPKPRYA